MIHATACVDEPCEIGAGTKVWHFSHIMSGATIGASCNIGQNVFVASRVRIGNNVKVQNNVSIYEGCVLEDDVFCGPSAVFTNVKTPRSEIVRKGNYRETYVERGATIGANATIVSPIRIGHHAFIAAGAVATKDVLPYALMVGVPARRVGWVGRAGVPLQRRSESADVWVCPETGEHYCERQPNWLEPCSGKQTENECASTNAPASARATSIPMTDLQSQFRHVEGPIRAAIERVLQSQRFILGEEVDSLESEIAEYTGAQHAVGCASGSDALLLAAMALDLQPGDEVLTTSYSFFATCGALWRLGLRPVFCDIDLATFNIDPEGLDRYLSPRTRALLPVHLFGQCCRMDALLEFARHHKLAVIEDAAQSMGARYNGVTAGTLGDLGCYSFFPSKNLGCFGDGGMVVTNHAEYAERLRALRTHGARKKYCHEYVGLNSRLDAIQAAILRAKLPYLDKWNEARRVRAADYISLFRDALPPGRVLRSLDVLNQEAPPGHVVVPDEAAPNQHTYNQFVIRVSSASRDTLRDFLKVQGIETAVYYPLPLNRQPVARRLGYSDTECPLANVASRETVALPICPELSAEQQRRVVTSVADFLRPSM
jgi:dTDP-4-amino-4,6-dideoxygalactose transaminase/acetyltransferase-like isoleucine patch superfamily enzyme